MADDEFSTIGLGTYDNTDPDVCAESVETALNAGHRHVDTAEMYEIDVPDLARIDAIERTKRTIDFEGAPWR